MDSWSRELRMIIHTLLSRLNGLVSRTSPATLQLTGFLGLVIFVAGFYQIRGNGRVKPGSPDDRAACGASAPQSDASTSTAMPEQQVQQSSLAAAVASQMSGVRRITISAPGVILQEQNPSELQDSATLLPGMAELLGALAATVGSVYIVVHVEDDIGEATVRGALEMHDLLGSGRGQVPSHRLLFCSTLEGTVAIVRQLEPDLHVESVASTVDALQRFTPQLLHVRQQGSRPSGLAANVSTAATLSQALGRPGC